MNRGIIQAPVEFRRSSLRTLAILLLIAATLSLQAMPLSAHHSTDHLTHCCAFCHFAHLAWANPAQALNVLALVTSEWHVAIQKALWVSRNPGRSRPFPRAARLVSSSHVPVLLHPQEGLLFFRFSEFLFIGDYETTATPWDLVSLGFRPCRVRAATGSAHHARAGHPVRSRA